MLYKPGAICDIVFHHPLPSLLFTIFLAFYPVLIDSFHLHSFYLEY